jgi:two-component system chemotaxis sensor kinase CheA
MIDDAFVREATASVRRLSNGLVAVEREPDDGDRLAELFRVAHSLKGNCAAAGLDDAASLAHAVEDVLDAVRRDDLRPTGDVTDDALAAVDGVEAFVVAAGEGDRPDVDVEARVRALRDRLDGAAGAVDVEEGEAAGDDAPERDGDGATPPAEVDFPEVPTEAQDISAEEALDRASVFDDLDDLLAEVDAAELESREFGSAGTFDDLVDEEPPFDSGDAGDADGDGGGAEATDAADRAPPGGSTPGRAGEAPAADDDAGVDGTGAEEADADPAGSVADDGGSGSIDRSGHVGGVFDDIKSEVDEDDDVGTLQSELEEVRFGEFDDDDDVTIQQLVDGDLGEDDLGEGSATGEDPFAAVDDAGRSVDEPVAGDAGPGRPGGAVDAPGAAGTEPVGSGAPQPRPFAGDAEPVIAARTPEPRAVAADAEPAIRAASEPEPRAFAAEVRRAITPSDAPEPRSFADDARSAVVVREPEPRALGTEPASAITPVDAPVPRPLVGDAEPAVAPSTDPVEPLGVPPEGGADDAALPGAESFDDGGFEWASADEPAASADAGGGTDGRVDAGAGAEPGDGEGPDRAGVDAGAGTEPAAGDADPGGASLPELDEFGDVDPDELADVDLAGLDDVDPDEASGTELPDLDAIDLELEADDAGSGDDALEGFLDEETAAFESRFADAFEEVADDAAAASAVSGVAAATTIEGSVLDASRFGGGAAGRPEEPSSEARTSVQSLSIDVERADELLTLAESLTVSRLKLERSLEPDDEEVEEALSSIRSVASSFRRTVMDIRLMPLRTAVERLPRVVRDVARDLDKEVAFETEGTDVRLDRSVIDRIGDPLVHVVRNAVDHGIEPPEEREARGKPREGRVTLRAERVRDRVVVEIEDDGRGIDVDAVRARAVEEGVVAVDEADAMSDESVYELLFESGLTTAGEVTEVSGRGVGMDVVDRALTELDGTAEVESEPGEGTTVRLSLPLNVAMSELWFVRVGDERYGVPASAVEQIDDASGTTTVDGRELFRPRAVGVADGGAPVDVDGEPSGEDRPEPVELVRLREAYDVDGDQGGDAMVLRLRPDVRPVALLVDDVLERQEVVVKPYGDLLGGVPGLSGATLRGDGRLVNVVDVATVGRTSGE